MHYSLIEIGVTLLNYVIPIQTGKRLLFDFDIVLVYRFWTGMISSWYILYMSYNQSLEHDDWCMFLVLITIVNIVNNVIRKRGIVRFSTMYLV